MKLQTSIPARRDGTLTVQGLDGKAYKFATDADGVLTGEVEDEATVAHLLGTGNFYPENPEDFDAALRLAAEGDGDDTGEGEGEGEGEGHDANQHVTQLFSPAWDERQVTMDGLQVLWDISMPVSDTQQAAWHVCNPIQDTQQAWWNLRMHMRRCQSYFWDVSSRRPVASSSPLVTPMPRS